MCFSAALSSENDHGSMNFDSKTAPCLRHEPVQCGAHPIQDGMANVALDVSNLFARIQLVPLAVERFGRLAELDEEVLREILWFSLAALLPPKTDGVQPHLSP